MKSISGVVNMMIGLSLIGFLIGVLIISLGGGGGGFYVGILTAFFDIAPAIAVSTSLATIIPTTAIGAYSHYRAGNVNIRVGLIMMSGAIIGAITGSICSSYLPEQVYTKLVGGLLLLLSIQMVNAYRKKKQHEQSIVECTGKNKVKAIFYGFLGGIMSGLIGVSGSSPIVAGLILLNCSALETVGTSVFVLVGISLCGFIVHLGMGNVDWHLVSYLAIGTILGAFLAPIILKTLDKNVLEKILPPVLIVIVFIMGLMIFLK